VTVMLPLRLRSGRIENHAEREGCDGFNVTPPAPLSEYPVPLTEIPEICTEELPVFVIVSLRVAVVKHVHIAESPGSER